MQEDRHQYVLLDTYIYQYIFRHWIPQFKPHIQWHSNLTFKHGQYYADTTLSIVHVTLDWSNL